MAGSVGRPTKFREEFCKIAREACARGATYHDLATLFGVSIYTIRQWRINHESFEKATAVGREAFDDQIVRSLAERATGYTYTGEKLFLTKEGEIIRAETTEHVPPDTTACIWWLKNRRPEEWRDRPESPINHGATNAQEVRENLHSLADALSRLLEEKTK